MNINSTIAAVLMLIGITAPISDVAGGLFWVFAVYVVSLGSAYGDPATRWCFKRAAWVALIAFGMAMFSTVIYKELPYVGKMPVEGVMGLFGAIYPLYLTIPKGLLKFFQNLVEKKWGK